MKTTKTMKSLTRLLVAVISFQMAFGTFTSSPNAVAADSPPAKTLMDYRVALLTVRDMVKANPESYLDPSEIQPDDALVDKVSIMQSNQALLDKVNDTSYSIADIRGELIQRLNQEEATQVIYLRNLLTKMGDDDVQKIVTASFAAGRYSPDLKAEYDTAYTSNDKKEVVFELLRTDLSDAKSDALKRLGLMDRKTLALEISGTNSLLNMKGDGWKAAVIIVISVIAAGLISYGAVSLAKSTYQNKINALNKQYQQENADLTVADQNRTAAEKAAAAAQIQVSATQHAIDLANANATWAQKSTDLQNVYLNNAALRDAGYTWQVCSTTNQAVSVTCPYNNKAYVGTQTCAKYCLKDPNGVQSGVSSDLICSSAQIPWECNTANATATGSSAGATDGYNVGYKDGYNTQYTNAYNQAYQDYYKIAYNSGYTVGYQSGYDQGYSDGIANGKYNGYNDGYNSGDTHGQDDGYPAGYNAGYSYGAQVGSQS